MTRYYPTRNDLDKPDKVERVVKDIYDRIYKKDSTKTTATKPKRINVNTGKVVE